MEGFTLSFYYSVELIGTEAGALVFHCQRWNSWINERLTTAKAFVKDVFTNQERKLRDRRWSDTVVVLTINDADRNLVRKLLKEWCRVAILFVYPSMLMSLCKINYNDGLIKFSLYSYPGNQKCLGSGGSMVARLKLKGIDGRAPQRSGACGLIWPNTGKLTRSRLSEDWQTEYKIYLFDSGSFLILRVVVHGRSWLVEWFVWLIPITNEISAY